MSNHIIRNSGIAAALFCGVVAVDKIPWPTDTNVTTNLPDTWRHLEVPTTTAHTLTSGPQRTTTTRPPVDEFIVVYAGRAITIHRTAATAPLFTLLERLQP